MRFGISATSTILPKYLRSRLRPVKERVILRFPCGRNRPYWPSQIAINPNGETPPAPPEHASPEGGGMNEICTRSRFFNPATPPYFSSTFAPASSSCFLIFAASSLLHVGLDFLRSALDEVLGFLEAQAGDRADFLDHVDLLVAGVGQNDGELGLLGRRSGSSGSRTRQQRPPERQRKRPTSLREAWRGPRLPEPSGPRGLQRVFRSSTFLQFLSFGSSLNVVCRRFTRLLSWNTRR